MAQRRGDVATVLANAASQRIADAFTAVAAEGGKATSSVLKSLTDSFRSGLFAADFRDVHQAVGELAQGAVIQAYESRAGVGPSGYRRNAGGSGKRYAGGALRRALSSPAFFTATSHGLSFGNISVLNKEAKHWARIAYGAAPAGSGAHSRFDVRWGSLVAASLGIEASPRPAFTIPRGFFVAPGGSRAQVAGPPGTGEFYPLGARKKGIKGNLTIGRRTVTRGIQGTDFFSPGLRVIAREIPTGYRGMYRKVWSDASKRAQASNAGLRLARPR